MANTTYTQINEIGEKMNPFFTKLVPGSGNAETLEGELVRAWNRMAYRHYNDGDSIFEEDGNTANAAFNFINVVNGNNGWEFNIGYGSDEEVILSIGTQLLSFLENDFKSTPSSYDFLDYAEDNYSDYDNDYDDEDWD